MIVEPFAPMLAVRSEPFDSGEFLFEVKWNGVRALAACDGGGWRLWGRELADYRDRYPELEFLRQLPPGTVLDGEVVLCRQGVPDLEAVLARHSLSQPRAIRHLSQTDPVTYVVFDALFVQGRCLFGEPLYRRRAALTEVFGPDAAAFRLDFPQFLGDLSARDRQLAMFLSLGHSAKKAAERFSLSQGRITQLRQQWCREWQRGQGEEDSSSFSGKDSQTTHEGAAPSTRLGTARPGND
jgi:hypothetical protein